MNLSFSVQSSGWLKAVIITLFVSVGLLSPLAYFTWWAHYGGAEVEKHKRMESLTKQNPVEDSNRGVHDKDFRLLATGGPMNTFVPGIGRINKNYRKAFGYRQFGIYTGDSSTQNEKNLNQVALEYLSAYNKIIFSHANQHYPDWRDID